MPCSFGDNSCSLGEGIDAPGVGYHYTTACLFRSSLALYLGYFTAILASLNFLSHIGPVFFSLSSEGASGEHQTRTWRERYMALLRRLLW